MTSLWVAEVRPRAQNVGLLLESSRAVHSYQQVGRQRKWVQMTVSRQAKRTSIDQYHLIYTEHSSG